MAKITGEDLLIFKMFNDLFQAACPVDLSLRTQFRDFNSQTIEKISKLESNSNLSVLHAI